MKKYTFDDFKILEKNSKLNFKLITEKYFNLNYKNTGTKLPVLCKKHGLIFQSVSSIKLKNICRSCYEDNKKLKYARFIKKFRKDYNYSLLSKKWFNDKYLNTYTKLPIICKTHGLFFQSSVEHFTNKNNCPLCSGVSLSKFLNKYKSIYKNELKITEEEFSKIKKENSPIKAICNIHGKHYKKFRSIYNDETGCPKCKNSKGERKIEEYLSNKKINFKSEFLLKNSGGLRADFYLIDYNIIIEYDGELHFHSIEYFGGEKNLRKTKERDLRKNNYCKKNNIKIFRIKYSEYKNINLVLNNYLKEVIKI